jgi:hypothetical protein
MTFDVIARRHEIAKRARAFSEGKLPRSEVLRDVEAQDYADPVLRPLLEAIQNLPRSPASPDSGGKPTMPIWPRPANSSRLPNVEPTLRR